MEKPDLLKGVDLDHLRDWLSNVDGHGVWKATFFEKMGFSLSFVRSCARTHNLLRLGDGKIGDGYGVGEDEFARDLAYCLGADTSAAKGKIGRGTRARGYAAGCLEVLSQIQTSAAPQSMAVGN